MDVFDKIARAESRLSRARRQRERLIQRLCQTAVSVERLRLIVAALNKEADALMREMSREQREERIGFDGTEQEPFDDSPV